MSFNSLSNAGGTVITVNDAASNNSWGTYSFGLNAIPVDTTGSTSFTYSGASGFASGTYPSMTAGYTQFIATIGGASHQVLAGDSGTITYNVTVR